MLEELLKKYRGVKTGKDLVDLGVIPKDSSTHLAIIVHERLKALRDRILADMDEEILGQWLPAFDPIYRDLLTTEITDSSEIKKFASPGMEVIGIEEYDGIDFKAMKGKLRQVSRNWLGIDWGQSFEKGHDLDGLCEKGHGYKVPHSAVKLIVPEKRVIEDYKLHAGAVADQKLGHKARFGQEYKGNVESTDGYGEKREITLPKGTIGTITKSDKDSIVFYVDHKIEGNGNYQHYPMKINDICNILQVSSLGQQEPLDKENAVYKQVLKDFFPITVVDTDKAREIIIALLMKKDMVFHGPPGSGKSQAAYDIAYQIANLQDVIFIVEGSKTLTNPFSLFDKDFAKVVPPDPAVKIEYDDNYKKTGFFKLPKPEDVKVYAAKFGDGNGIETIQGNVGLSVMDLLGFKLPSGISGISAEEFLDEACPKGFNPGSLMRTNNGILIVDEIEKIRPQILDVFLSTLESNKAKSSQLKYSYPTHNMIIGTCNDPSKLSLPINDRMLLICIPYAEDVDTEHEITLRSFHGKSIKIEDVLIPDTHQIKAAELNHIPMPSILERVVDAFYIKFRKEYDGAGKNPILGSPRSKKDALAAARAAWTIDKAFFSDTSDFVDEKYTTIGIEYALHSRVQEENHVKANEYRKALSEWVRAEFPKLLMSKDTAAPGGEVDTWWCRLYKHISISKTQIPKIEDSFLTEIADYKADQEKIVDGFNKIKKAHQEPANKNAQKARLAYPFMDYLFKDHPNFEYSTNAQVKAITSYFIKMSEYCSCKLDRE